MSQPLYLGLLALLGCERLFELWLSKRNAARSIARGAVEVGQGHFRAMAAVHALFLVCCAVEVIGLGRPFSPLTGSIALAGLACAQALRYWAVSSLGDRWNVRIIVVSDEAPITTGPYRFLRHPNYLAVAIEIVSVPMIHGAWITAAAFTLANLALLRIRIPMEERALGAGYARAFSGRPRFIPRTAVDDRAPPR